MSLIDAKYYPNGRFFWDQRAATLEEQTVTPIQDHIEMGMTLPALETKLQALAYYHIYFKKLLEAQQLPAKKLHKRITVCTDQLFLINQNDVGRSKTRPPLLMLHFQ